MRTMVSVRLISLEDFTVGTINNRSGGGKTFLTGNSQLFHMNFPIPQRRAAVETGGELGENWGRGGRR